MDKIHNSIVCPQDTLNTDVLYMGSLLHPCCEINQNRDVSYCKDLFFKCGTRITCNDTLSLTFKLLFINGLYSVYQILKNRLTTVALMKGAQYYKK